MNYNPNFEYWKIRTINPRFQPLDEKNCNGFKINPDHSTVDISNLLNLWTGEKNYYFQDADSIVNDYVNKVPDNIPEENSDLGSISEIPVVSNNSVKSRQVQPKRQPQIRRGKKRLNQDSDIDDDNKNQVSIPETFETQLMDPNEKKMFTIVYGPYVPSKKKKQWKFDGYLMVKSKELILYDSEQKIIANRYSSLPSSLFTENFEVTVGNYECQIIDNCDPF